MTNNNNDAHEKNIKIFVRILPLDRPCESCARIDTNREKIYIRCLQEMQSYRTSESNGKSSYWCFQADKIFYNSSQEEVYRVSAEDLVSKILGGVSCVLMGYGQTGSGKSFTISGLRNNWEHRGLVARILSTMFAEKSNRKKVSQIQYRVSFVELRGKEARDLLRPDTQNKIKINNRNPFKDISIVNVENEKEALEKIFEGEMRRSILKGSAYPASHLGTSVITFHVSNVSLITSWGVITTAKVHPASIFNLFEMHIIEMAGTGTVGGSNCWKPAVDVGSANLTKIQLEQFFSYLAGLRTSASRIIHSSNFLKILGTALSVSSVVRFISHVRITEEDFHVTLSSLRLMAKIAGFKPVKMKEDIKFCRNYLVQKLREEVNSLKKELMLNNLLLGQEAFMNISKSRMEQINRSIMNFLNGSISEFTVLSVSQGQALLKSIKDLYNRLSTKELEGGKMKESFGNVANDVIQVSVHSIKDSLLTAVGSRKFKPSGQRLIEMKESSKEEKEEVGNINKSSVTLGPYEAEKLEAEGSKDEETRINSEAMKQVVKKDDKTVAIRQFFDHFIKEEKVYARIKEQLDRNETTLVIIRQRFSILLDNYFQAKRNLQNAHDKLSKQQKIRSTLEIKHHDDEEKEALLEMKDHVGQDIACYQKVVMTLGKEMTQKENEIQELLKEKVEEHATLKFGFQDFCNRRDFFPLISDDAMKTLLQSDDKEHTEAIRQEFNQFQRSMKRREASARRKKVQPDINRRCKSSKL